MTLLTVVILRACFISFLLWVGYKVFPSKESAVFYKGLRFLCSFYCFSVGILCLLDLLSPPPL